MTELPIYRHHSVDPNYIVTLETYDVCLPAVCFSVPAFFVTDGASIPTFAWSLVGLHPLHHSVLGAALVHDYLYRTRIYSRKASDKVFHSLLKQTLGPKKAYTLYLATRWFGFRRYKK